MYKIVVYIPSSHTAIVKSAMFKAGAGTIGNYDCCSFEFLGTGQFRPMEGSNPYLGDQGKIESVEEFRVEMVCKASCIKDVIMEMKQAHPYEVPAYDIYKLENENLGL